MKFEWFRVRQVVLALLYIFMYSPMIYLIYLAFTVEPTQKAVLTYPWPPKFSLDTLAVVFSDTETVSALGNSATIGLGTAFIVMILTTLAAWGLTQFQFKNKTRYLAFFITPIIIPNMIVGIAGLIYLVQLNIPRGLFSAILFNTTYASAFGLLVNMAVLNLFKKSLLGAAADLGAPPLTQFKEIVIPMIWPGIFTSFVIGFILGFTNFDLTIYAIAANPTVSAMTWSMLRHGFRAHIFGLSAFVLLVTIALMLSAFFALRLTQRKTQIKI